MKISDKYPKLDSLLGACFNQDWDDDYASPELVIIDFAHLGGTGHINQTIAELKTLLKEKHTKTEWYQLLSEGFGCSYALKSLNIDPIEWLKKVQRQLEDELILAKEKEAKKIL